MLGCLVIGLLCDHGAHYEGVTATRLKWPVVCSALTSEYTSKVPKNRTGKVDDQTWCVFVACHPLSEPPNSG